MSDLQAGLSARDCGAFKTDLAGLERHDRPLWLSLDHVYLNIGKTIRYGSQPTSADEIDSVIDGLSAFTERMGR